MTPVKVFIGFDPRDDLAFQVCQRSLLHHASVPVEVIPLKEWELRRKGLYWRAYFTDERGQMWDQRDGKPFSTQFSFTRFAAPLLADGEYGPVVFCDADMLWRADIRDLMALWDPNKAVMCVKHDHRPGELSKMDGVMQTVYARKNWSSLMLLSPVKCRRLTRYVVNNESGSYLHGMKWAEDKEIGALPEEWNWLEGWSPPETDPSIVHFTRGTPDMIGNDIPYADEWGRYLSREAAA